MQETLLVASRMATRLTSERSRPSSEEVDAHQHVELTGRRSRRICTRCRVSISEWSSGPHPHLHQVVGEVLGHLLGELVTSTLRPASARRRTSSRRSSIWRGGPDHHLRVHQAGGPDHLLHHLARLLQLPRLELPTGTPSAWSSPATPRKRKGRLSTAEGSRKPWSTRTSLRLRSPWNCRECCGIGDVALVDHGQEVLGK